MKISINDLTSERQWRSATGYTKEKFLKLLAAFEPIYIKKMGEPIENVKAKCPGQSSINSCEELLLFTLFSLKAGLTYDNLGFVTGMDGSNAKRNQDLGLSILKDALQSSGVAPKREFTSLQDFEAHFSECDTLIIDGTEQRVERSQDKNAQKENYSGRAVLSSVV